MYWASQKLSSTSLRHSIVTSARYDDDDDDYPSQCSSRNKKLLEYQPRFGTHWLWFNGWPVTFTRSSIAQGSKKVEEISLRCFKYSPSMLRDLLDEAYSDFIKQEETKTVIYRASLRYSEGY